ncbi:hypothetical protein B0H14DRAFT_3036783 [Mycena olivaceomarginata]|nr:hypothetical protein B0H14DRAFT_3036783 [Mycena olivaceomarginata]
MPPETLVPETERILRDCPQCDCLLSGRLTELRLPQISPGKSSLIGHTFGIDVKSVSTDQRGKCNIYTEIHSPQNSRFILHDSMGFEPGNVKNLQNVKNFISERSGANIPLKERVHAIWLCIQVPRAGGRAFETGDEEIVELALAHKVPVVVVFTQRDKLLSMINFKLPEPGRTPEEIYKLCAEKAQPIFQECCVAPLAQLSTQLNVELSWACTSGLSEKRPNPDREALYELVNTTCNLVQKDMGLDASIVYAMAQRASAELKINTCVDTHFPGRTLQKCLETVHQEMTESWNFYDPDDHLVKSKFMDQVKSLAQLATADETEAKSWFKSEDLEAAKTWIGLAGATLAASAGPVIGVLGVTAWFAKFVSDLYYDTPETLRCFMAYLIDLTLVLHELFYRYGNSDLGRVHSEVRRYVSASDWEREAAEKKMKNLILYYSSQEYRARRTTE